jgi:hypothetical protein
LRPHDGHIAQKQVQSVLIARDYRLKACQNIAWGTAPSLSANLPGQAFSLREPRFDQTWDLSLDTVQNLTIHSKIKDFSRLRNAPDNFVTNRPIIELPV